MLAWMAGIPNRVGYAMPDVAPFLTTAFPPPNQGEHVVMHSARLLERWIGRAVPTALKLTYPIQPNDAERVAYLLSKGGITPEKKIVVIHPGAGSPIKRWTAESWAIVAERIASKLDAAVVLTGADAERGEVAAIMDKMRNVPALSLAGETNVAELAALYSRAALVLGPDSGPLHLAVAVGTPTVHLYGPADPARFGPWGDPQRHIVLTSGIACRPCNILAWSGDRPENHPCIRDITPRQVMDAAFAALNVV
jgi:heptosyltransferase-2/heptosyltransferase-3